MSRWCRVFGTSAEQPAPAAVLEYLRGLGVTGKMHFRGDSAGWTALEVVLDVNASPLVLECFLSSEDGIRKELNSWAAWLETCEDSPHHTLLMERVIQTKQLYTLRHERLSADLCRWLARMTDGIYQCDEAGFFAADGTLLIRES